MGPNLPHLNLEEPKRSKLTIFGIALVSLLVLTIPIGVYLATQPTSFLPKAAQTNQPLTVKVSLEAESPSGLQISTQQFFVDIKMHSDIDPANLVVSKISFPTDLIEVTSIATGSAILENSLPQAKWVESSFDNNRGAISLIAGIPNPGIKTDAKISQSYTIARVTFNVKKPGQAKISFEGQSEILRNSDNSNILNIRQDLTLQISSEAGFGKLNGPATPSAQTSIKQPAAPPQFTIITPSGGETFAYFRNVNITWNPSNIDKVTSIDLFLNDSILGSIATNPPNNGFFSWNPSSSLLIPYVNPQNTYQVKVIGTTKDGQKIESPPSGPFSFQADNNLLIVATPSATLIQNIGLIKDNPPAIYKTISEFFSSFNQKEFRNKLYDLNSDGVLNGIDLWILRNILIQNGVINP